MDQASDELRKMRAAHMRSSRAADELLIEAIFGDVVFGRAGVRETETLSAADPTLGGRGLPGLSKEL